MQNMQVHVKMSIISVRTKYLRGTGVSAASLYYYFDSKEDLLYQILDETMSTGLSLIWEIEQSQKSLKEKLSDFLKIHTRAAVDFNKMKLLVHGQNSLSPEHREVIKEKQRIYVKSLISILDDLKQTLMPTKTDPSLLK